MSALCVAELLALMVSPSPSLSASRSRSPGMDGPGCGGDGDGGWTASVQNSVRGPWSSQKWQRATKAVHLEGIKKSYESMRYYHTLFLHLKKNEG